MHPKINKDKGSGNTTKNYKNQKRKSPEKKTTINYMCSINEGTYPNIKKERIRNKNNYKF